MRYAARTFGGTLGGLDSSISGAVEVRLVEGAGWMSDFEDFRDGAVCVFSRGDGEASEEADDLLVGCCTCVVCVCDVTSGCSSSVAGVEFVDAILNCSFHDSSSSSFNSWGGSLSDSPSEIVIAPGSGTVKPDVISTAPVGAFAGLSLLSFS